MKRVFVFFFALLVFGFAKNAHAQTARVVATCAGETLKAGASIYLRVDTSGQTCISTTGLATAAKQDTGNASLASIDGKILASTDPCFGVLKTVAVFSISSATTTQLVAASSSNKVYICSIDIVVSAANNVALVEDDTSACASPTAGMAGGTTAATGWNFTTNNTILTKGSGAGTVFQTATTNRYVCLITSGTAQTSGSISYVLNP